MTAFKNTNGILPILYSADLPPAQHYAVLVDKIAFVDEGNIRYTQYIAFENKEKLEKWCAEQLNMATRVNYKVIISDPVEVKINISIGE